MATAAGRDFLDLEKQFWSAMQSRDAATATRLSDDSAIVVGPQGIGDVDRASLGKMVEGSPYEVKGFELSDDFKAREIAPGVVICAYKVSEDMVVDGESAKLDAYDTSVWVKKDDAWVCAMHTESLAGDPFGRDRQEPSAP